MSLALYDREHGGCGIAVAAGAAEPERFAAEELQRYLGLATGGTFPIRERLGGKEPGIVVGVADPGLSEDGYVMRRRGAHVELGGGSPRGTLYAAYHFLEKYLGFGWPEPGDDAIPRLSRVGVGEFEDREEPVYPFRSLVTCTFTVERMRDEADWMAKNRLNWAHPGINSPTLWRESNGRERVTPELHKRGLHQLWGGHSFQTWIPNEPYFRTHPEYFALVDGERREQGNWSGGLCLSNPELQAEFARNMGRFLDENPGIEGLDLWPNDTPDWCECAACAALEGETDYERYPEVLRIGGQPGRSRAFYRFASGVARALGETHPEVWVSVDAYYRQWEPAEDVALPDNVLVGFADLYRSWRSPLTSDDPRNLANRETLRRWLEYAPHVYLYEYYSYPPVNAFSEGLTNVAQMAEELRWLPELGLSRISSEGAGGDQWRPLVMYAYARLVWNPDLAAEGIIEDFCRRTYGDVAEAMLEFWRLQETREPFATREKKSLALLQQAQAGTEDPAILKRFANLERLLGDRERLDLGR